MRFSRQEYWSGLTFPSPGYLPNPGIEPRSPALQADSLQSEPPGKPQENVFCDNLDMGLDRVYHKELRPSLVAQMVRSLPSMQETQVQSPGWEDSLKKGMETHCSVPAWRIPGTEELCGLQSMGSQRVGNDWMTNAHAPPPTHTHRVKLRKRWPIWLLSL